MPTESDLRGQGTHRVENWRTHLSRLRKACVWIGVSQGRAQQYCQLIEEFWSHGPSTREHIFAHNESFENVDLFELWETVADEFPGLQKKIVKAVVAGPILREDERPHNASNRSRNDAFVYHLARELLQSCVRRGTACI
jgi:hypothetical protein